MYSFLDLKSVCFSTSSSVLLLSLHTDFSENKSGGLVFHFFKNSPHFFVTHTIEDFNIVNKTEAEENGIVMAKMWEALAYLGFFFFWKFANSLYFQMLRKYC